jgi:hypothetical protein
MRKTREAAASVAETRSDAGCGCMELRTRKLLRDLAAMERRTHIETDDTEMADGLSRPVQRHLRARCICMLYLGRRATNREADRPPGTCGP